MINGANQVVLPGLNVASSSEQYWFKVTTPSNASNVFTAQVQSSNLSELSPKVTIFNPSLQGLASTTAATNVYGTTITASITNATPNTTYYIRVSGSNTGANGSGAYDLTLNMGTQPIATIGPPNTTVAVQADQGGSGIFEKTDTAALKTHSTVNVSTQAPGGTNTVQGLEFLAPSKGDFNRDQIIVHAHRPWTHPINMNSNIRQRTLVAQSQSDQLSQD